MGLPPGRCACQESTLIRLASGQTPSPFEREGLRAGGSGTRPYGELRKRFHAFVGAGPRPARQDSHRERWFGKPRRSCGTAPFEIFRPTGRRRRPPTQSPAQRVCVGEEERWSERALPGPGEARDTKSATTKWPGGRLDTHSNFARRNCCNIFRYASPVMGPGCSDLEQTPAAFWLLCRRGQSNPPSADGGISLRWMEAPRTKREESRWPQNSVSPLSF